jgi:MFS family permease
MFSITILVYGFMAPLAGNLVDRFQPRVMLSAGAAVVGAGIALCSLASTQWQFYLLYGVMTAIGLSMIGVTPLSAVTTNWFATRRGLMFGILAAGFGLSLISAPINQLLISSFGWRSAYVIIGAFCSAVIIPLCLLFMRHAPQQQVQPGGLTRDTERPVVSGTQQPASFSRRWGETDWTLHRALRTHQFWLLTAIAFIVMGFTEQIVIAHQVYFLRDLGCQPMTAASIYGVFGIAFVVGNAGGLLSDRLGRERVFIPAVLLMAAAMSFLLFGIKDSTPLWILLTFAICFGLGQGAAPPACMAAMADLFHGKRYGSIQGAMILGSASGGALGAWLAGALHDLTGSYFTVLVAVVLSSVLSAVLMWLAAPRKV